MVATSFKAVAASLLALPLARAQVTATFPNGVTNPDTPEIAEPGSTVNQTSYSRLLTLNSVDDFCIFGPPEPGPDSVIGNVEPIVVAYCTKPRNGARLIPDGTIHAAHFVKTDAYVQINGLWDGTRVNIPYGDAGGELDPHGAENVGNPIGGNVTSNVSGQDVFYEEWMSFVSFDQFCMRICTAEWGGIPTSIMCEHELDVMGCAFVLPSVNMYNNNTFTSCEADVGAAPGDYPQPDGSTSTFRQRYVGSYTNEGTVAYWTVGQDVTPAGPATTPAVSMCTTYSTISNGIDTANFAVVSQEPLVSGATAAATTTAASSTGSMSMSTSAASTARNTGASTGASTARPSTANTAAASGATSAPASAAGKVDFGMGGLLLAGAAAIGGGLLVLA